MSVPKSKRKLSRFEAFHQFYVLRREVTQLVLLDFGFSVEKYEKQIRKYADSHRNVPNIDEVVERYEGKCKAFQKWYIDEEARAVLSLLRKAQAELTMGNSIFPSEGEAKLMEYCERRKHLDNSIGCCYALKQEIQYVIETLPVDINKYKHFADLIDNEISLIKGMRQADNRFLKKKDKDRPAKKETGKTQEASLAEEK